MDTDRYSRQITLQGIGVEGQERLAHATIGVMGVGGLGSPVSMYLAAAGIGHLILADPQTPEKSNLNRQVLHWTDDVGLKTKVDSAARKLSALNPMVKVTPCAVMVTPDNINSIFEECDIIMDCLDSVSARMVLNDYALETKKPIVHSAVEGWHGQITVIMPGSTPCLACLFPRQFSRNEPISIIGAAAGTFGCLQAGEAIKLVTEVGQPLISRMLLGDLSSQYWNTIKIDRAKECPACSCHIIT
ncbi:MAG: HesA/MoeB/ThiF family protein [Euryarchaeota archaeon]|nr:HesA/MoeB/ThiF family protein [Euryarchaeota archaeon]